MKLLYIFLIIINFYELSSQNYLKYYEIINLAELAHLDKKYSKSDSFYEIAFKNAEKPFKEDYYLAALNADKLKDNAKVYNYLKMGVENGLVFTRVKKLKRFCKSEQYNKLKQDYKRIRNEYLRSINIPLRNEILEMIRKDQKARKSIFQTVKQWTKIDSNNYKRLLEIIAENDNKWPGFSTIGEITPKGKYNVSKNITLMLLHFKKEWIDTLKPYMFEAVIEGNMYPYHYARIIDYKHKIVLNQDELLNGKTRKIVFCLIYGTYTNSIICDCEKAEIERKKIGFEPLKDYYRKINSTYTCKEN